MVKLAGLTRRVREVAFEREAGEELSRLVEETRVPGEAACDALIDLVLGEDFSWDYGPSGHAQMVAGDLGEVDEIGSGDDETDEDGSDLVDDYYDPDDDVDDDGGAYGTGGAVDPELVGMMDGAEGEGDPDDTSDLDSELAELEDGLEDDDGDPGGAGPLGEARLRPGELAVY